MTTTVDHPEIFEERNKFYSKNAIAIWTFILSPFMGCILFAYNLKNVGKGKLAPIFILVGIFWTIGFKKLTSLFLPNALLQLILSNLIGSMLLTFFLWDKLLGDDTEYTIRPVWKPVLIFVGICTFFLSFNFFAGHRG